MAVLGLLVTLAGIATIAASAYLAGVVARRPR